MIEITFDPVLWRLGPLALSWHGLFTMLAVGIAVWVGIRRSRRMGFPEEPLIDVAVWAIVGGIVGARLFFIIDHIGDYISDPVAALSIWRGGIAVYGAFLGGIFAGFITARRVGLPVWPLLDAAAPAMLIGQAVGRLGCLSNGDAWGGPTGASWGLVYQHPGVALPYELIGVPTHPYPVYEIAGVILLLGILWLGRRQLAIPGTTFLLAALGYAAIRFGLSFYRQESEILWGLQQAQLLALGTGIAALALLLIRTWPLRTRIAQRFRG